MSKKNILVLSLLSFLIIFPIVFVWITLLKTISINHIIDKLLILLKMSPDQQHKYNILNRLILENQNLDFYNNIFKYLSISLFAFSFIFILIFIIKKNYKQKYNKIFWFYYIAFAIIVFISILQLNIHGKQWLNLIEIIFFTILFFIYSFLAIYSFYLWKIKKI